MIKVDVDELKAAILEIESRSKQGSRINVQVFDRKLHLSSTDNYDNTIEAIIYDERALGAEFRLTERLMYMKGRQK